MFRIWKGKFDLNQNNQTIFKSILFSSNRFGATVNRKSYNYICILHFSYVTRFFHTIWPSKPSHLNKLWREATELNWLYVDNYIASCSAHQNLWLHTCEFASVFILLFVSAQFIFQNKWCVICEIMRFETLCCQFKVCRFWIVNWNIL